MDVVQFPKEIHEAALAVAARVSEVTRAIEHKVTVAVQFDHEAKRLAYAIWAIGPRGVIKERYPVIDTHELGLLQAAKAFIRKVGPLVE